MDLKPSEAQEQLIDAFAAFYAKECTMERVRAAESSGHDAKHMRVTTPLLPLRQLGVRIQPVVTLFDGRTNLNCSTDIRVIAQRGLGLPRPS